MVLTLGVSICGEYVTGELGRRLIFDLAAPCAKFEIIPLVGLYEIE